ncbi:MAG TPA: glycosyltransferase [Variovorax sp.]|nr:glycosyltransferase [Variovorax sp.]
MSDPHVPTISVVLATFNGAAFLERQLDSLAAQTRLPLELVVSDDGSTDGTRKLIQRFQRQAPFPVVAHFNARARGFRENFLLAARSARGRWIAFCDQDDIWHPRKLEVCAVHMAIPGITQIAHQADLIDAQGRRIGGFDQGIARTGVKRQLAYDLWGTFWGFSVLFDRRILEVAATDGRFVDYIDERHLIAHDRWVCFLARTLGHTVEIAEPLVQYRQHGDNLFGHAHAKPAHRSVADVRRENAVYLLATRQMRDIVERFPAGIEKDFPFFDRDHALRVFDRAACQLRGRERIYDSGSATALLRCMTMMLRGDYRNAQDRSVRWRSFAKDLGISLKGA